MPSKTFEQTLQFHPERISLTKTVWLPIVTVTLHQPNGDRLDLPLLFDTGASTTTLRHDLCLLFGASSWEEGELQQVLTAGGESPVLAYRFQATLELFGKVIHCPIHLQKLPPDQFYVGLLGREQIFQEFGFGFWERTKELYVTLNL